MTVAKKAVVGISEQEAKILIIPLKGEEDEEKGQQQRQQRLELLDRLAAEKKQLEQKKLEMQVNNKKQLETQVNNDQL